MQSAGASLLRLLRSAAASTSSAASSAASTSAAAAPLGTQTRGMAVVVDVVNGNLESALARLRKRTLDAGLVAELKRREFRRASLLWLGLNCCCMSAIAVLPRRKRVVPWQWLRM